MDKILPKLYQEYGKYSNWRNLPSVVDGFKPVERRTLYASYKICKNQFVKSRQVDAYTIGHYHPHGQVYGTIVQLVHQGFLDGQGNFGSNIGVEPVGPAAPRYTECKLSKKSMDYFFKLIDHVPFIDTELNDKEPEYLPAIFPGCLVASNYYSQGIGFGYKSLIPCYKESDLFERLKYLLGIGEKVIIKPLSNCHVLAKSKDLEMLLTTGKARIAIKGKFRPEPRNNTVRLYSWPPNKRFESILSKFSTELSENMIGFTDVSSSKTEILFQVLRERKRDTIFKKFVEKLDSVVQGTISFEMYMINRQSEVVLTSVDELLFSCYKRYCEITGKMLLSKKLEVKQKIENLKLVKKIQKPLAKCIQKSLDIQEAIKVTSEESGVEKEKVSEIVNKYRISKLLTVDTDTSQLEKEEKELSKQLEDVEKITLEEYKTLMEVYGNV